MSGGLEWRVNMPNGMSQKLEIQRGFLARSYNGLKSLIASFFLEIWSFLHKAWNIGVSEPKKVIHCLKLGLALSVVSLFYYVKPLYDGVGGNAMWAVMTVVVVFEYTVGATLCKCINRAIATFLAGSLAISVHWVASQSGKRFEPVIVGVLVFLLASAATFSRFIPIIKARFDYGVMIFILTFSLVSVSGYRVEELVELARSRLSTIAIGVSICLLIIMLICPIWAGTELHLLINCNMEKLADSLEASVGEYFNNGSLKNGDDDSSEKIKGYKCVLNSKATEEAMANFARWEPTHGPFSYGHPWKQYLKIGAAMRECACCIESLRSCINSEIQLQVPEFLNKNFQDGCMRLSIRSSDVLKELSGTMKTFTKSSETDLSVREMNFAVEELRNSLKSEPSPQLPPNGLDNNIINRVTTTVPLIQILPLATTISLLIEIAARVEGIVEAVDELATLAEFQPASNKILQESQSKSEKIDGEP